MKTLFSTIKLYLRAHLWSRIFNSILLVHKLYMEIKTDYLFLWFELNLIGVNNIFSSEMCFYFLCKVTKNDYLSLECIFFAWKNRQNKKVQKAALHKNSLNVFLCLNT